MKKTHHTEWQRAEYTSAEWLKRHGIRCRVVSDGHRSPWDLLSDAGQHIEVKSAHRTTNGRWNFSVKRHGVVDESGVDWYVCALRGLAPKTSVYVTFKAPVNKGIISMSTRSLFTQYADNIGDWQSIARAEKRRMR